jgi:hypothetical protein
LHNPAKAEFALTPDGVTPQAASPESVRISVCEAVS